MYIHIYIYTYTSTYRRTAEQGGGTPRLRPGSHPMRTPPTAILQTNYYYYYNYYNYYYYYYY